MLTQTILELQYNAVNTFTHFIENKNNPIIPSTAKISIYKPDNTIIIDSQDMTINGTTGVCIYNFDTTGQEMGRNFYVKYQLDSYLPVIRFFDIYKYPFVCNITDDDLIQEDESIRTGSWEDSGVAESGTNATLVDTNRHEDNDHWNGGIIQIYHDGQVHEREITDWVQNTSTFSFRILPFAVTNENYFVRNSYQLDISEASIKVQLDFRNIDKRAYLLIDHYQIKYLIIYKFFEHYYFKLRESEGDKWDLKFKSYAQKYSTYFANMTLNYDSNEDAVIDDDEKSQKIGQPTFLR